MEGRSYCVASGPITETGFDCPAQYPHRHREGGVVICSEQQEIPSGDREEIARRHDDGSRDGEWTLGDGAGAIDFEKAPVKRLPEGPEQLDLLWVIDNSGSMCEEQEALRASFRRFIETLRERPIDFNMAVTTTNYRAPYEVVAPSEKFGHIQSTPHPAVGFDAQCRTDQSSGDIYAPLRTQIRAAVACTKNPEAYSHLTELTDAQIKCALEQTDARKACQQAGWDPRQVGPAQLFPSGAPRHRSAAAVPA